MADPCPQFEDWSAFLAIIVLLLQSQVRTPSLILFWNYARVWITCAFNMKIFESLPVSPVWAYI